MLVAIDFPIELELPRFAAKQLRRETWQQHGALASAAASSTANHQCIASRRRPFEPGEEVSEATFEPQIFNESFLAFRYLRIG
jgi:hypothetical protein